MDNKAFVKDALKAHNEYRSRHKVSPLKLNKELTATAQQWADHMASTGTFQHRSDRNFKGQTMGENIAMKWTSGGEDFTGQQVTNQWYSEVSKYNYSHGGGSGTGHYTQVVWKDSQEFGIGRAKGRDGKWLVVGNFIPAGNFMGRYQENVFPPKDGKTSLIGDDKPSGGTKQGGQPVVQQGSYGGHAGGDFGRPQFSSGFSDFPGFDSDFPRSSGFSNTSSNTSSSSGGRVVSKQTRTVTEGVGANRVTKTIVTETIVNPDGSKETVTKETVSSGH